MGNSKIEWTQATWNPIRGCSLVSPGCKKCYAMKQAHRFSGPDGAYEGLTQLTSNGPVWTGKVKFVPEHLADPLKWKEPRRIFVNSMSDLFHDGVTDGQIDAILSVIALCPQHTFQILTKRPGRMLRYFSRFGDSTEGWVQSLEDVRDENDIPHWSDEVKCQISNAVYGHLGNGFNVGWPLRNVWLGVSCENQATADERIPLLLQTPAAVRWVSAEPLLGPIELTKVEHPTARGGCVLTGIYGSRSEGGPYCTDRFINWLVAGGESGPGARPMHPDWARSLRDQCKAAGVPFFFKQWGEWEPYQGTPGDAVNEAAKKHAQDGEWLRFKVGKKAAGRLLDGREHSEYPEVPR